MPSSCIFELNKPDATYCGGEDIVGTATLRTTSDKNVRDISIIFLGSGKIKWEAYLLTDFDRICCARKISYRSRQAYINKTICIQSDGILSAGTYTYTFNIHLPRDCPASCEEKYGHIRYEISLKINRYFRSDNVFKMPVTILRPVDLNLNPTYKLPLVLNTSSRSGFWPFSKDTVFLTLKIPLAAYAPGQCIKYTLQIDNQSMADTDGYFLEFAKKITFTARSPYRKRRHCKHVLISKYFPIKCLRQTNRIIMGEFIMPPTNSSTESSSIIYREYFLKVKVLLPGCRSYPQLKLPIIVGSIPIRDSLPTYSILMNSEQEQVVSRALELNGGADLDLPPNYSEIKPPTFEEANQSC